MRTIRLLTLLLLISPLAAIAQSSAIHHDVAHGGSLNDGAIKVKAKVLIIAAAQDHMVNPKPALDFAGLIGAKTLVLESDCGHLAPGCEADRVNPAVRDFLAAQ